MANRWGETMETVTDFIFLGSKISEDGDGSREIKRYLLLGRKSMTNLDSVLTNRGITLLTKVHKVTAMVHRCMSIWCTTTQPVVMYRCESWTVKKAVLKNWCFWTVMLEKTLESPLDSKEIKPVNPKGDQPWIFIGRTDAEAPNLWPPDAKSRLIGKDLDVGKDWGQEKKGITKDEMAGWHHWLNAHECEQTPGDSEGQESLACCCPQGLRESDTT